MIPMGTVANKSPNPLLCEPALPPAFGRDAGAARTAAVGRASSAVGTAVGATAVDDGVSVAVGEIVPVGVGDGVAVGAGDGVFGGSSTGTPSTKS